MTTPDIQPCTCCYHDSGELLANLRRHIKHVVVLVLENRSFDNLCGYMQGRESGQNPELEGVNPGFVDADTMSRFSNPIDPHDPYSPRVPVSSDARVVTVDPPHEFVSINWQLFGNAEESADKNVSPSMQGTICNVWKNATNYWLSDGSTHPSYDKRIAKQVMECFSPQDVPVLHELVQEFGLCDHWFSSLPGPTLPNRYMLLSCTTKGIISNAFNPPLPASIKQDEWLDFSGEAPGQGAAAASKLLPPTPTHYDQKTLCDLFAEATDAHGQPRFANPWRIYYHDFPIALGLTRLQKDFGPNAHPNRFHLFPQFVEDCNTGNLPTFAFIEPRYLDFRMWPENEQHPPADIKFGEYLIADVYQALRNSPAWEHTMLIVTYDEHGALYDHVPPPRTVPPDSHQSLDPPFAFDRLGLHVPTVIISP